jgi:hypothetical protein
VVTADVADSAGFPIIGSPFDATSPATGLYQVTPTASATEILDVYTVTWNLPDETTRTTEYETVGGFLFTLADLRAFDPNLADTAKYPAPLLTEIREATEDLFEAPTVGGVAFRPKGRRVTVGGDGTNVLVVPDLEVTAVRAAAIDGVALSDEELADLDPTPIGMIFRKSATWPRGRRNVEVLYEHGLAVTPAPITRAAKLWARYQLVSPSAPLADPRASAVFTDVGGYRLTLAGRDGPTGLPEVDAVLSQFGRRQAGGFA